MQLKAVALSSMLDLLLDARRERVKKIIRGILINEFLKDKV